MGGARLALLSQLHELEAQGGGQLAVRFGRGGSEALWAGLRPCGVSGGAAHEAVRGRC